MSRDAIIRTVVGLVLAWLILYEGVYQWMFCYLYVPPDHVLVLNAKIGRANPDPENLRVVDPGYKGVRKTVYGEGRHFYDPFVYDRTIQPGVVTIGAREVGIVESKSGKPLPEGEFLVDDLDHKGIWRRVLTPGKWRLNPVAFQVTVQAVVDIQPGFVGCVTHLSGDFAPQGKLADAHQRGIQKRVLQPGLYYFNPYEMKVTVLEIGYRELYLDNVAFPSKDGFTITLDTYVVWGLSADQVPWVVLQFGSVQDVIDKIIRPQVESICRIEGSKYAAREFIEGTAREKFQTTFTESLSRVCTERHLSVVNALVRSIQVPKEILEPIQLSKVAEEERLTKEEQQKTQTIINELEELKADVEKGVREVGAETERLIASVRAEGEKKVAEIYAQQGVEVAVIEKKIAEIQAERTRLLGKANADVAELKQKAQANRLERNVAAVGGPASYANMEFATKLPTDLKVFIRYAGPGTFWTDLPTGARVLEEAANRKILEQSQAPAGK